jgi:hypothetical protein
MSTQHRPRVLWLAVTAMLLALFAQQVAGQPLPSPEPSGGPAPVVLPVVVPTVFRGDVRTLRRPRVIPGSQRLELEQPDGSLATATGPDASVQSSAPLVNAPGPSITFPGLSHDSWGDGWPPDTNGDVGPSHYIQTVNTSVGIFRKTDGALLAAFSFNTLFSSAATGTPCDNSNQGDPVVVYDGQADHWIISDFAWSNFTSGAMYQCFAVSITGNPVSGGWFFYAVQTDAGGHIPDYPKLGVWPDAIYMSANIFNTTGQQLFQNVRVWAFNRSDLESGQTLHAVSFDVPAKFQGISVFSLLPSNLRGDPPVAGRPNLFASIWGVYAARIWKFHVDWTTPGNSTFSGPSDVSIGTFSVGPGTVPEKAPGNSLDTLTYRVMMQNQYRRFGSQETLWLAHTVGNGSGIASVRWYQLNVTGGTVTTSAPVQQGTFNPDSNHRFMPSLAVDGSGDMAIGYSVSSSSTNPSIRYAGRLVTDAANTLGQGETTLWAGTGAQTNTCGGNPCQRWGDYSAMSIDPVDDCTFWYTNEYYEANGGNWQTRIGAFKFASCTGSPVATPTPSPSPTASPTPSPSPTPAPTPAPNFALSASPTSRIVKQGVGTSYGVSISRTNFSSAVDLSVSGLPSGATGSFSSDPASGTSSTLSITTSKSGTITPVGTYSLTIKGVDVGGSGLTRSTSVTLVVTDGIPPDVAQPKYNLYYVSLLGSTSIPTRVYWAATDSSGVVSYQVQRQVNGEWWSVVSLPTPTTTAVYPSLTLGYTYRYKVVATDGAGNSTSWIYGNTVEPLLTQQSSSAVTYTGTWTTASSTDTSGGSLNYATAAGASASFTFNGSGVAWVSYLGPNRGSANVYVDGVLTKTVSLYSTTNQPMRIVYAYAWGANGTHTIEIVVAGTAGHPRVDLDALGHLLLL